MLLGLQVGSLIVIDLLQVPRGLGWRVLAGCTAVVAMLLWTRATLLLNVSWAIGVEMTFTASWARLRGNLLRILGFGFLSTIIMVVLTLTCADVVHGSLRPPFPTVPPLAAAILFALGGAISPAVPCAIYRHLVLEPASPGRSPELDAFAA